VPSKNLVQGRNVIAVELHNWAQSSIDLGFDMGLRPR
jgi:hypothetical protein